MAVNSVHDFPPFDPNQAGSEADCKFPRLLTIHFFNLIQP